MVIGIHRLSTPYPDFIHYQNDTRLPSQQVVYNTYEPVQRQFAAFRHGAENDGKFSLTEASKNLLKGILSPVKQFLEHPLKALAFVGGAALAVWWCPPLMSVLLASGIVFGGLQLGSGALKLGSRWFKKDYDGMEKACETVGQGVSTLGLSTLGVKQGYKTMSLKEGTSQCLKDGYNVGKEILTKRSLPTDHTVVLITTTSKQKIADLKTFVNNHTSGHNRIISVTGDPQKTQLNVGTLADDESVYGTTYEAIARGKAAQHSVKELLNGKLQNMDDAALNGKTLAEAFPGRRYIVMADDSGFEMSIPTSKLPQFEAKLKEHGMSDGDIDYFINTNTAQGIKGLERIGDRVEILGIKTHPNLEALAKQMNFMDASGKPDIARAEAMLANIMKEMNVGGEFGVNTAVAARDILASNEPVVTLSRTKGVVTNEASHPEMPKTDIGPLPDVVKVVDDIDGLNGVKLSQADRSLLPRNRSTQAVLSEVYHHALRERALGSLTEGTLLNKLT